MANPGNTYVGKLWECSVKSAIAECRDDTAEEATWTSLHNDLTKARKREEFIMQSHLLLVKSTLILPTCARSSPTQWHPMIWQWQVCSGRQNAKVEGKTLWSGTRGRSVRPVSPGLVEFAPSLAVERVKRGCKDLRRSLWVSGYDTHTAQAPRGK